MDEPSGPGGQVGMAGIMMIAMFLRLLLVLVPIFVVCRIMTLMRDASLRAQQSAEPRPAALERELQSLMQVGSPYIL